MTDTPTTDLTAPEAVERWHEEIHGMKDGPALFEGQQEYVRYEDYAALSTERAKLRKGWSLAVDQCDKEYARAEDLDAKLKEALEVIKWYGDRAKDARLIHSGGDAARHELQADGGKFARAFLARLEGDKP